MAAQMGAHARQQNAEAKRLGYVIIGAGFQAQYGVGLTIGTGKHQNRRANALLAHQLTNLAPINIGQPDIQQNQIKAHARHLIQGCAASFGMAQQKLIMQR